MTKTEILVGGTWPEVSEKINILLAAGATYKDVKVLISDINKVVLLVYDA